MADITKEEMRERLGNIDQIRDIIFGPQLREYDNRFDKLESDISLLQQEMRDRIDQVRTVISTEIRSSIDALDKKIKSLNLTSQEELTDLRQQIDRVNKKFSNTIEALDQTVDNQTHALRDEILQAKAKLQEDVRSLRGQVYEEVERRFGLLREDKISRHDMAEFLFEVGMRLKGNEFVPQLREAAELDVYTEVQVLDRGKKWE